MPPVLREFQQVGKRNIYKAWSAGAHNVMFVSATGSGKTVVLSDIMNEESGASAAIAHRQELVSQISVALARNEVRHRIIGATKGSSLTRVITALQVAELGYSYLDPNAKTGVGGVDKIVQMTNEPWFKQVRLVVQDEGHHVLKENKWGRAAALFPNARGLYPTATPVRADGYGLGRDSDGLMDTLVEAPSMRDLIDMGYLTDYRIFAPPNGLDLSHVAISQATGDFNSVQVRQAVQKSTVTGDVVEHYLRLAKGKLGVTFCVDVETSKITAEAFRAKGIPAEVISAKTPDALRASLLRKFKNREILQLTNCDLFGEGFDLPAIEVVSFARPTEAFNLYVQQFGRTLRLMIDSKYASNWDSYGIEGRKRIIAESGKPYGLVIDHVGNVCRHGLPDARRTWSLDRRERSRGKKSDAIPLRVCAACLEPYERVHKVCPHCGYYMPPAERSGPEFVDGDLTELDPSVLAALRGEIARIDGDFYAPQGLSLPAQLGARKHWIERQDSQRALRNAIAWWAGLEAIQGYRESESYRRFFFRFGVDVANAQLLGSREAEELAMKVTRELANYGIDGSVNAEAYFTT